MMNVDLMKEQKAFLKGLEIKGKSFNTLKNYQTDLNTFNKFLEEKKHALILTELPTEQLKEYSRYLEKKYSSPNSIRRRIQALRIFFDWLIEQGIFPENPIKKLVVSPKVVDKPRPLSFDKVRKLYKHLDKYQEKENSLEKLLGLRNKLLFHLVYGAGLKVSDIESLQTTSLFKGDIYRILVSHPKRDPYTIPLPDNAKKDFDLFEKLLEKQKEKDQIEFSQLFFNANPFKVLNGGLSARGIEILFKDLSKQLDMTVTAKNLRQACIFKWLNQDRPETQIKEWMGVQPIYSLKPYKDLLEAEPSDYSFMDMQEEK